MKIIAISQRLDPVPGRDEYRDGLDVRWAPLLLGLGLCPVPVPNGLPDPCVWARALGVQGLLLSGGNDVSGDPALALQRSLARDSTESALLNLACELAWPVLGVCRGLQHMNRHLGGRLRQVAGHVATRHRVQAVPGLGAGPIRRLVDDCSGLRGGPGAVNSFHQHGLHVDDLAPPLRPWLVDDEGLVEAAEHMDLPWAGILWHPEREPSLGSFDGALLKSLFQPQ